MLHFKVFLFLNSLYSLLKFAMLLLYMRVSSCCLDLTILILQRYVRLILICFVLDMLSAINASAVINPTQKSVQNELRTSSCSF